MMPAAATPADAELLRRYSDERSEAAFAELVRRHLDVVHSAALRQVGGNSAAAADIAQAVFTELARQASRLARHPALVGWLYTTTHRLAVRQVRDESRRQRREREAHAMHEAHRSPDPEADWNRLAPVLDEAMHELAEADRLALLLRHFEQRPFADVGARLGLSENAARMRVDRALDRLRARLAKRGITSTASVLSATLVNGAVTAGPVGLVAHVTTGALASVGAASAVGILSFMASAKIKVAVMVVTAGLLGTGLWVQERRVRKAETQLELAAQERTQMETELAALRTAAAGASNEVVQAKATFDEVLRLRGEVARLRRDGAGQSREYPPADREFQDVDHIDAVAGAVVNLSIPAGQMLLTGGWISPSGKRVLVAVRYEVDGSGELPVITVKATTLEASDDHLSAKGFTDFLTPVNEARPQRFISQAELKAMVDGAVPGMIVSAAPELTTYSGRQGSLTLAQDGSDVAMSFDMIPYLKDDGGLALTLIYGTMPARAAIPTNAP